MALVNKDAAILIKDSEAVEKLLPAACGLIENEEKIALLEKNIAALAKTDAAMTIAEETYRVIGERR
jgi:UDP-N-acetylglucosamine--N-acetylmuramyl-(pentapeptide) pyrophosphoryl-undecaprenol N-acetylglucosamine transferase